MAFLPPASALKQLEPRPGGQWSITGQSEDTFELSYIMDGGAETITYTVRQCTTEEEVQVHCGSYVYEFTAVDEFQQDEAQIPVNLPLPLVVQPTIPMGESEAQTGQLSDIPNQNQVILDTQAPIFSQSEEIFQENPHFEGASTVPPNQVYQESQTLSIGSGQQEHSVSLNSSETIGWSFGNGFLSSDQGNVALPIHNAMVGTEVGNPQINEMFPPATWPENWTPVNDPVTNEMRVDWESMFSSS